MNANRTGMTALSVVLGVVLGFSDADSSNADTVFFDDFSDGSVANNIPLDRDGNPVVWTPLAGFSSGTFDTSTEGYVLTSVSASGGLISLASAAPLGNTSIRTQMRLEGSPAAIAVFARADPIALTAYQGGIDTSTGNVYIALNGTSTVTTLTSKPAEIDVTSEDVVVQFDVVGNNLSLFVWPAGGQKPADPTLSYVSNTFSDGVVGIITDTRSPGPGSATFRFVHVADTPIPEPSTLLLVLLALGVVGGWCKWKRAAYVRVAQ
jgi:hypothetical protein